MIFGNRVDKARLEFLTGIYSTKIQTLNYELASYLKFLAQLTDQQIEDIFTDGGDDVPTAQAKRASLRTWQVAVGNLVQNYTGEGSLNDASFEVAKRYNPSNV